MPNQLTNGRAQRSARFWAWMFLIAGGYALACFPAVLVFEHFHWFEAPLHMTAFCACILAVTAAIMYLIKTRAEAGKATFGVPTRTLAFITIILAGGFVLFASAVICLLTLMPSDF